MLQQSTIRFLTNLKKNNNKAWFDAHKDAYLDAKSDFEELVQRVIIEYRKTDVDIGALQVKDCVFRIYKDVRFSKDKTPYKTHLAAGFNLGGKKVHFPGYYFHAEPGGLSFCGGGIWHPDVPELKKIRQEIDYNFKEFKEVIEERKFKKLFDSLDSEEKLSRAPQGYDEDNPALEYLKLKNYIAGISISDQELTSGNLVKKIVSTFKAMKPLIDFLSRAIE